MKAIIIAAGKGSRLQGVRSGIPKCLLRLKGKTILERQIAAFNYCGITDISVIKGYKKEKIDYPGLKYYINEDYENNNILNSLFYAEEELNNDIIISYSDIIYDSEILQKLIRSRKDIAVVIDMNWKNNYKNRNNHTEAEAENVIFDERKRIIEIGKGLSKKNAINGEFIGLLKLTKKGADAFKIHFHKAKKLYWEKQFVRAGTFQNAYLTDMLQHLACNGIEVSCVVIEGGWFEIDTAEDYNRAEKELKF